MEHKPSFWTTLPGILTGLAALVTAFTGLYLAIQQTANNDIPTPPTQSEIRQPTPPVGAGMAQGPGATEATDPTDADHPPAVNTVSEGNLEPLVDCGVVAFQLPNTIKSLMSWSDYYHGQIEAAEGKVARALDACRKAAGYRGSAYCQQPSDLALRQALFETLSLCRAAGIDLDKITAAP